MNGRTANSAELFGVNKAKAGMEYSKSSSPNCSTKSGKIKAVNR